MLEQKQQIYSFNNFRLDVPNRQLLRDGRPVPLPAKAFDMLVVLIENGGRLVGKDELFSSVWPDQIVEESNLTVQVSAIRRALGDNKDNPHYIVTVPGHGYRFTSDVVRVDDEEEEVVIEHHSHSRIVVETEKETGAEQGSSVALANAPEFFASGNDINVPVVQSTAIPGTREISVFRPTVALPPVAHVTSRSPGRRWLGAGVGTLAVFASAFLLYRYLQRTPPAAPLQQITLKRLTSNGKAVNAALSPDGKLFAFVLGTIGNPRSLWLGHVNGGEPIALRPLAAVDYPTLKFSPDSNSLYYVITGEEYQRGSLFRVPVFGGAPEKLRENIAAEITLAPDMKQFVFVRIDEAKRTSTLVIANIDGPAERELVTRSLDYRFLAGTTAWSPDGKTIAVGAVSDENRAPAREVLLVTVADGQLRQLTSENYGQVRKVSWLNDRELLIIAVEHTLKDAQIWHVYLPSGEVRPINSDLYSYDGPLDLSANGDSLLAIEIQTLTNIWVAPAGKLDQAKKLTFGTIGRREGTYGLEWTPTGRLVYSASEDKSQTLWMMEADGSKQKQLTPAGYVDEQPTATADGRFIVFQSNRSGNYEVWRMNADGSGLLQVTNGGNNEQPSVSPDGKWVVYVSTNLSTRLPSGERLGTLWRVALEGGVPLRISDGAAAWPRVSPDGQLIACAYSTLTGSPHMKLALIPIAGGQPLKLFDLPPGVTFRYGLRWTPDGAAVAYRDWVNGIWRQPIEGGAPQRLPGLPEEKLFAYGWSPDGRQFAFTRGAEIRDVVLMRNFR
jgi:Tol biopolymer transport system component/DNA-binding winged helix-turn-helix (wHTH) protein